MTDKNAMHLLFLLMGIVLGLIGCLPERALEPLRKSMNSRNQYPGLWSWLALERPGKGDGNPSVLLLRTIFWVCSFVGLFLFYSTI